MANCHLDLFYAFWITQEEHLVVLVTVQNMVGLGAAVSIICKF